jgi:hypothetical protein
MHSRSRRTSRDAAAGTRELEKAIAQALHLRSSKVFDMSRSCTRRCSRRPVRISTSSGLARLALRRRTG